MKTYFCAAALIFGTTLSAGAFANNVVSPAMGGFSGPVNAIGTVKAVLDAGMFSDDQPVSLTGYITQSRGGETYTFQDATGVIDVEIDHDKWFGQQVTPKTKVAILGEIDKEFNYTTIDVDSIRIVQ
ncbi:YgiW/YdeI family stress tolerance OB fold protein [Enterovibrio coralii]|uniref:Uncharacterized protein n=1 Tax=Enterovibrio coralii TaxID=294935 RepID=A0A135I581_9GAMM|nr:NirD/YgiW/YdeI family stress tolerance protein [Enterovibrio coralii]KXF80615.1 hypothetical protein ATN88_08125 [Enterovibrio coralii]